MEGLEKINTNLCQQEGQGQNGAQLAGIC